MAGKLFAVLFGVIWIGGWSTGTIFFDSILVSGAYHQWRAQDFAAVDGTVTGSEVEISSDSEGGTSYKSVVHYAYNVDGGRYENRRIRYGMDQSGSKRQANAFVAAHPVDGQVTVYYNPSDPADSLLRPGIGGSELFLAMFLTPFNLIMLGSWAFAAYALGLRSSRDPGQLRVQERTATPYSSDVRLHVKMPAINPLICGAAALLATSFVAIFAVGFTGGFDPPLALIVPVWAFNLGVAGFAFLYSWQRIRSGAGDLIVDRAKRVLLLPAKAAVRRKDEFGKKTGGRLAIPFDAITNLKIDQKGKPKSGQSDPDTDARHAPVVVWRDEDGQERSSRIGDWTNHARAAALYDLLRRQCPGV